MNEKTICALASAPGNGAIAVIRISGTDTFRILDKVFRPVGKEEIETTPTHRMRYGSIYYQEKLLDEVLVSIFRAPHSYTGEDSAEIYCHGSQYIIQEIIISLISAGATHAAPGEFSRRAFFNGKMDLAQAEAVADLIQSETEASHKVALQQMRGGFSNELREMRKSLLNLVSLMELELDFSEEDVEFADRGQLMEVLNKTTNHITKLIESFKLGNAIKNGVPVTITGATNTGKSTLLNKLVGEERAIVSDIHGTTRDTIEERVNFNGVTFRFIDTAGIRNTTEAIELIGIERTNSKILQAEIIILVLDASNEEFFYENIDNLYQKINPQDQKIVILINKNDTIDEQTRKRQLEKVEKYSKKIALPLLSIISTNAKAGQGIEQLKQLLTESQQSLKVASNNTLVANIRHYEALKEANDALQRVAQGISDSLPTDLLTQDIREAIYYIGSITGKISTDEILGNIFENFCIGK